MNATLAELDREWSELGSSRTGSKALERWSGSEPVLVGLPNLATVLERRSDPAAARAVLAALARHAGDDPLAARTLLQALLPGLVRLAGTSGADDPAAIDEVISLAWERIRTYPTQRPGSVAGNVLLDVRKRYRRHRDIEAPKSAAHDAVNGGTTPSAEDFVLNRSAIADVVAAHRDGVISRAALTLILRTRVEGQPLDIAAAEQSSTVQQANCIRWRAERRLRPLLAEAS